MSIAPWNLSYLNREPYISIQEFKSSPIATTVDVTQLIPEGGQAAQDAALTELIVGASTYADNYCLGPIGTLNASVNTENGRFRADRYGRFTIHPMFWPILEVVSFSTGPTPSLVGAVPVSSNTVWIEPHQFSVMSGQGLTSSIGPLDFSGAQWASNRENYCQWVYINGWANTFTTASAAPGSSTLSISDATGIYPGSVLTIWDGAQSESITVASGYNGTSLTLPIVGTTSWNHGTGTNISALPKTVKDAVIHFTVAAIKQRGEGGIVLTEDGGTAQIAGEHNLGSAEDLNRGEELLEQFVAIWGQA
jgi:hypothetical protein